MTANEHQALVEISARLTALKDFLNKPGLPDPHTLLQEWLIYLDAIKQITGNASNGMSLIGCLMAK